MLSRQVQQPLKVLIAGGSYGGLAVALNLLDLCEARPARFSPTEAAPAVPIPVNITIVDERDGYYHLIGSPLALANKAYAEKAWRTFDDIPALQHPSIKVIQGTISDVDPVAKTATITALRSTHELVETYDFFIAATGLRRVWPTVPQKLTRLEYLAEVESHINRVSTAEHGVVVVGGGAVGIEMAAELKLTQSETKVTLIHSRGKLMSAEPLPDELKDKVLELVHEADVETIMGQRVTNIQTPQESDNHLTTLTLSDGSQHKCSHVINAVSQPTPTTSYLPAESLDPEDQVRISPSLHFPSDVENYECHFAVGDLCAWSGIKRCGGAMHMGHHAGYNIHQQMMQIHGIVKQPEFKTLAEFPAVIGVAVGKQAVGYSPAEGVKAGEDVLQYLFKDDLGFTMCWDYLRLGETSPPSPTDSPIKNGEVHGHVTLDVEEESVSYMEKFPITELQPIEPLA